MWSKAPDASLDPSERESSKSEEFSDVPLYCQSMSDVLVAGFSGLLELVDTPSLLELDLMDEFHRCEF
jgi:hypothetical protein